MGHLQAVLTTSALQGQCSASCPANTDQMSPTFGFFLTHPFLSSKSHRESHLTALSTLLHRYHSAFFPREWSPYSLWKGQQDCPAAARGEGGRLPHKPVHLWNPNLFSMVEQIHQLLAAISKMDICSTLLSKGGMLTESLALWRWGVRISRLSHPLEPAPGRTSWKLPPHRLDNTSIRANLASTPWDTGLDLTQ